MLLQEVEIAALEVHASAHAAVPVVPHTTAVMRKVLPASLMVRACN